MATERGRLDERRGGQPTTTGLTTRSENSINWNEQPPRIRAWKDCITKALLFLQRDVLTGFALLGMIQVFEDFCGDIPTELLPAVLKRSLTLTDKNGTPIYWDGRAMNLAYWKMQEESDGKLSATVNGRHLLTETAASACPRCQGTGLELMPDGTRRKGCKHDFTSADEADLIIVRDRELVAQKAKEMREGLAKIVSTKAMPAESVADKITVLYTCTACRRKESSEFGWQFNDPCGARLPGPVREDERLACQGRMQVL